MTTPTPKPSVVPWTTTLEQEAAAACEAATPAPWDCYADHDGDLVPLHGTGDFCDADAHFVNVARVALPAALAELERLRSQRAALAGRDAAVLVKMTLQGERQDAELERLRAALKRLSLYSVPAGKDGQPDWANTAEWVRQVAAQALEPAAEKVSK